MKTTLLLLVAIIVSTYINAQLSINATGTDYTIDFDNTVTGINNEAFSGSGFTPSPAVGQLNSNGIIAIGLSDGDVDFGGTNDTGDFARGTSTGKVGTGGIYSFETSTGNFSIGIQPIGEDFTSGTFTVKLLNNTGNNIDGISISYDILVYNDQDRANGFNFAYSLDNSLFSNITELDYSSPEVADKFPSWVRITKNTTISETVNNGSYIYVRWYSDDVSGGGSRDEFALDNIVINASLTNEIETIGNKISMYPTPFNKHLTIKGSNIKSTSLIDLTGKTIIHKEDIVETEFSLPTNSLPRGIYLIRILKSDGSIITKKVMKK